MDMDDKRDYRFPVFLTPRKFEALCKMAEDRKHSVRNPEQRKMWNEIVRELGDAWSDACPEEDLKR